MSYFHRAAWLRSLRAQTHVDAVHSGFARVYAGTVPTAGAAITDQTLLAEFSIGTHAAEVAGDAVITPPAALALATGVPTFVRFVDSGGAYAFDMDAGAPGSGAYAVVTPPTLYAGGTTTLSVSLREPG